MQTFSMVPAVCGKYALIVNLQHHCDCQHHSSLTEQTEAQNT